MLESGLSRHQLAMGGNHGLHDSLEKASCDVSEPRGRHMSCLNMVVVGGSPVPIVMVHPRGSLA